MKKLVLSICLSFFLVQFFTYGQTKLTKKAPVEKTSVCSSIKSQVKKTGDEFTVSLNSKTNKIDDWVLIPEVDKENPLHQKRNRISTPKEGKYILAVKMKGQEEICTSEIKLSNSISRAGLNVDTGFKFRNSVCKNKLWFVCFTKSTPARGTPYSNKKG